MTFNLLKVTSDVASDRLGPRPKVKAENCVIIIKLST